METVGQRIAAFRHRRGLTLRSLGEKASVTDAYISQIEKGRTSPSLAVLERLAKALDIHLVDLLEEGHELHPEDVLVRSDGRPMVQYPHSGASVRYLVPPTASRQMRALHLTIPPGDATDAPHVHSGEDFGYVLAGELELTVGERTLQVRAGDTFSFPGVRPHGFANHAGEPAEVIWVVSAPEAHASESGSEGEGDGER